MRQHYLVSTLAVLAWTGAGCSETVAPTLDSVAGSYSATSFQADGADVLAAGGSLTLELTSSGAVTGDMFVPASVGGPFDADMAGTYEIVGSNIIFDQDADTFVRDAEWMWSDGTLTGSFGSAPDEVLVRMER